MDKDVKFGPTNDFPEGKHDNRDQPGKPDLGGLQIGITHDSECVIMNFGYPIDWLGMSPERAESLAMLLLHHAGLVKHGPQARIEVRNG